MKKAYIQNNIAVDVIRVDPFAIFHAAYAELFVEVPEEVEVMWRRSGDDWFPPVTPDPVIPDSVTPLQGLLALDKFGMAAAYEEWASSPDRTFAERSFINRAQTWRRNDPTLLAAASAFNLTPEQLDALFIEGAQL